MNKENSKGDKLRDLNKRNQVTKDSKDQNEINRNIRI